MNEMCGNSVEDLRICLDNWSTKTTKNKRKKKKGKERNENIDNKVEVFTAEVETLGNKYIIKLFYQTFY